MGTPRLIVRAPAMIGDLRLRSSDARLRCASALLLALILFAAGSPVNGQSSARFRQEIERSPSIEGLTPAQTAEWTRVVDQVAALLRGLPGVTDPPEGICTLVTGQTGSFTIDGHMRTGLSVQIPVSWSADRGCAGVSNGAVSVHLNGPGHFMLPTFADVDWDELRVTPMYVGTRDGATLWEDGYDRWAVITHGRAPLLDTLTHEEYLRRRSSELEEMGAADLANQLRQRLRGMSAAERSAPACFARDDGFATLGRCRPNDMAHVLLNRNYFDSSLPPQKVQLIVVRSRKEVRGKEDPRHYQLRAKMFEALDLEGLGRLIGRS